MSDYALRERRKALERATRQELLERVRARSPRRLTRTDDDVIRAGRDSR